MTVEQRAHLFFEPPRACNQLSGGNRVAFLPEVIEDTPGSGTIVALPNPTLITGFEIVSSPFADAGMSGTISFGLDRGMRFANGSKFPLDEIAAYDFEPLGVLDIHQFRDPNVSWQFPVPILYRPGDAIVLSHGGAGSTLSMNVAWAVKTAVPTPAADLIAPAICAVGGNDTHTKLLLRAAECDGSPTTRDSSWRNRTMLFGGTALFAAQKSWVCATDGKFGGGSLHFSGTAGGGLTAAEFPPAQMSQAGRALTPCILPGSVPSDWDRGAGDWTFDGWVKPLYVAGSAIAGVVSLPHRTTGAAYGPWSIQQNGSTVSFTASSVGGAHDIANQVSFGSVPINTWTHVALQRRGSVIEAFNGGSLVASVTVGSTALQPGGPMALGVPVYGHGEWWQGRISMGRYSTTARYSSSGFTPPTGPYCP